MKRTRTNSPQNKVIGAAVVLIAILVMCRSCTGGEGSEDAGDIAPLGDFPATVIPADEPTDAPTDEPATEAPPEATATDEPTDEPATEAPPTATDEPTVIPATEEPPTAEPALPTDEPEQPAEAAPPPAPSNYSASRADPPPADQPWLPCAKGQLKGNLNSMKYHAPGQRDYGNTYANVQCFNTHEEAQGAGFVQAKR